MNPFDLYMINLTIITTNPAINDTDAVFTGLSMASPAGPPGMAPPGMAPPGMAPPGMTPPANPPVNTQNRSPMAGPVNPAISNQNPYYSAHPQHFSQGGYYLAPPPASPGHMDYEATLHHQ